MFEREEKKVINRREIEEKLSGLGDYVKMDFLQQCLKKQLDFDTRRYVLMTLSEIYEKRMIFYEPARLVRAAADINTTFEGKMNDFLRSAILFIKAGNFGESDVSLQKAMGSASERQKIEIKRRIKEAYKIQAREFLRKDKRKHSMETYEKLLSFELDPVEKMEAQKALLDLYDKLGKVKEYYSLQKLI